MDSYNIFLKALSFTLKWEGGYSNHPYDRGGPTNKGITQLTYDNYCKSKGIPNKPVKLISDKEVEDIYYKNYFKAADCDKYDDKIAIALFDFAVHSGVVRANDYLRKSNYKISDYISLREDFLRRIAKGKQSVFLKGWLNRIESLKRHLNIPDKGKVA